MGVALVRGGLTLLLIQLALLQPSESTSSGRQVGFSKRLIYQPAGAVVCSDNLLRRTDQCMQRILLLAASGKKGERSVCSQSSPMNDSAPGKLGQSSATPRLSFIHPNFCSSTRESDISAKPSKYKCRSRLEYFHIKEASHTK